MPPEGSPHHSMIFSRRLLSLAALPLALATTCATAWAQASPASPAPSVEPTPTFMDREYDGNTHVMLAPYIWGPTVHGNFQYSIPTLPGRPAGVTQTSVNIAPADYAASLNSAAMFAFDARRGSFDVFGDYIYVNASASASATGTISGRFGKIQIPVSLDTNAHLRESIWEVAAGATMARGHNADLGIFMGLRELPVNVIFDYAATIGKRNVLAPSGSITEADITQDVIVGLRGKAFLGDGHWYVPYYIDVGTGIGQVGNQTWEGYSGAGYAFSHGQTLLLAYRSLSYDGFSPVSHVQKLTLSGPLLGYTFNL